MIPQTLINKGYLQIVTHLCVTGCVTFFKVDRGLLLRCLPEIQTLEHTTSAKNIMRCLCQEPSHDKGIKGIMAGLRVGFNDRRDCSDRPKSVIHLSDTSCPKSSLR